MREKTKQWLDIACERAGQREASPEAFKLKQLFSKQEWKQITNDFRRDLGREFSYAVSKGRIDNVRCVGKSQEHHNLYLKS